MVSQDFWNEAQELHFEITRRSSGFRFFIQEALALNMAGRLIAAAEHISKILDPTAAGFLAYIEKVVRDWALESMDAQGRLCRLVRDALTARKGGINTPLRTQMQQWALKHHPHCYLCGVALDFNSATKPERFTLDHIWPNSYGGDSTRDNLLPCCDSCNSAKKSDYASWAACDVHSLIISSEPSSNELSSIPGRMRFAMHNRAIRAFARKRNVTLKDAYLRLGPWLTEPWFLDEDVGDFFNLANYEPNRCRPYGDQLLQVP